jgi:hypothetical protein
MGCRLDILLVELGQHVIDSSGDSRIALASGYSTGQDRAEGKRADGLLSTAS